MLRQSSLDELPQLWNVFIGEMSLVGPRPERPQFVHQFKNEIPDYMLRHKMKAGITGLAQVNGYRDTCLKTRINYDIRYIKTWSILLDLKIILKTFLSGFLIKMLTNYLNRFSKKKYSNIFLVTLGFLLVLRVLKKTRQLFAMESMNSTRVSDWLINYDSGFTIYKP